MKTIRVLRTLFLSASVLAFPLLLGAQAEVFFDDFEREEIGDDWLASGGDWSIAETEEFGRVLRSGASNTHVLIFQGFELDDEWEMEINFHFIGMDMSWNGVTFHARFDEGNVFRNYVSRLRTRGTEDEPEYVTHQFLEFENFAVKDWRTPPPHPETALLTVFVPYRLVVSSTGTPGVFGYRIFDEDDELLLDTVLEVGEGGDWSEPLQGGWAGLYDIRAMAVHDFRLTVGEEMSSFAAWQDAHFTTDQLDDPEISGPEADPAGDGVSNLLKYALDLEPWESSRDLLPRAAVEETETVFFDDFERQEIGPNWSVTGGENWRILEDSETGVRVLRGGGGEGTTRNNFIYFNGFELSDSWTMVAHAEFLSFDANWEGFGMNIQQVEDTYRSYIDRFRAQASDGEPETTGHQFLEGEGAGVDELSFPNTDTAPESTELDTDTLYRFELAWDAEVPDTITLAIRDNGTTLLDTSFDIGGWNDWTGAGYAGFYDIRSMAVHDVQLTVGEPGETKEHLTMSYTRLKNAPDIDYDVQVSTGLPNWESGPEHVEEVGVEDLGGDRERVTVRAATPVGEEAAQFLRLVVTQVE